MLKIQEHSNNTARLRKGEKTYVLDTSQDHGNNFFWADVCQCNIALSVVHGNVCFNLIKHGLFQVYTGGGGGHKVPATFFVIMTS